MIEIQTIYDTNKLSSSIMTFGNFDGVHLGHTKLIKLVKELSSKHQINSVLLTFSPNTKKIVNTSKNHTFLTSFNLKKSIINNFDIDILCKINFNKDFSLLTADSFMELIINKYNPKYIVLGYDNKFGKDGLGSYDSLVNNKKYNGITFHNFKAYTLNKLPIKTSTIKSLIINSDIVTANKHLGRKFTISGLVVKGRKIARTMGYPTANIKIKRKEQLIPSNGVYSVNLIVNNLIYMAICNIGTKPTFGNYDKTIEVHILNKNENLYDMNVSIEFNYFIRTELKFNNKKDLENQINKDIELISNKENDSVK